MIERVARWLFEQFDIGDPDRMMSDVPQHTLPPVRRPAWTKYRGRARDLIAQMRQPTTYMIEAGEREYAIIDDGIAQPLFSTMIDAALEEEG